MSHRVHLQASSVDAATRDLIHRAVVTALARESAPPGEVTLRLTDEAEIQALNARFLDEDRPTDVLAFPDGTKDPDSGRLYLGDVIIAVPVAARQAARAGHGLAAELALLAVHGVLHLLGHDHAHPEAKARMWQAQQAVLAELGVELGEGIE